MESIHVLRGGEGNDRSGIGGVRSARSVGVIGTLEIWNSSISLGTGGVYIAVSVPIKEIHYF